MNFKRLLLALTLITAPLHADIFDDYLNHEPHLVDLLDDTPDEHFEFMNDFMSTTPMLLKALPDIAIVLFLLEIGAIDILEQDFFLSTNRPARRSLLDMPLFQPNEALFPEPSFLNAQFFFNMTPRARFTRTSNNIDSYIATSDPTLLAALDAAIKKLRPITGQALGFINIRSIMELVSMITLVERNIGLMLQTGGRWDRMQLRIMFPIYYHERNFFLSQKNLDQLSLELGFSNPTTFDDSYAIADRLGVGDTRVEFGVHALETQWTDMVISLYATIPTAFTIARGLAGNTFCAPGTYPNVDFTTLYDTAEALITGTVTPEQQAASFVIIQTFLLEAWDRVAAALLDNGLGDEAHPGLGICATIDARFDQWVDQPWASCVYWHNRIAFEYLFQNDNKRFYINNNNPANFDRDFTDPDQASENLEFLQNEIINRICLLGLSTKVQPGVIGMWKSALIFDDTEWNAYLGTDFWFQTKESHGCIHAEGDLVSTLSLCKSIMPWAFQNQIIGGFGYTYVIQNCSLTLGLDGAAAIFSTGVGHDFMITLRLDTQF